MNCERFALLVSACLVLLMVAGCASGPPKHPESACADCMRDGAVVEVVPINNPKYYTQ